MVIFCQTHAKSVSRKTANKQNKQINARNTVKNGACRKHNGFYNFEVYPSSAMCVGAKQWALRKSEFCGSRQKPTENERASRSVNGKEKRISKEEEMYTCTRPTNLND